ncbi:MAG: FtsX-like permease family protein [Thermodesulfobacteriota bacterium]|nr:FtsX-like permease family protein [Thermodesulfobacteriota bacterium]
MRRIAALKMLLHDRSTTAGSVSGVIAIIFLVGQQLAIFFGLLNYMSILVDYSGADIWVVTQKTDNINSAGTLPMRYIDRMIGLDGIEWAEPIIISAGLLKRANGNYQPVQIAGMKRPRMAGGAWHFHQGSLASLLDAEGISVDLLDFATLGDPEIGDVFEINKQRVRLKAITLNVRGFGGIVVFTNMNKARDIAEFPPDRCSSILVKVTDSKNIDGMKRQLKQLFPNLDVITTNELSRLTRLYYIQNTGIGGSFGFTTIIGALVGVVIIALTMYTNVLNKQKDYAVLRALGARKRDVLVIVMYQSIFIALMGIVAGFTLLALFVLFTRDSNLPSYMPLWVPPIHAFFTLLLCMFGSLLAMQRAIKIDPASAFR